MRPLVVPSQRVALLLGDRVPVAPPDRVEEVRRRVAAGLRRVVGHGLALALVLVASVLYYNYFYFYYFIFLCRRRREQVKVIDVMNTMKSMPL